MDDDERQVKVLLTRAADIAGRFEAPPVEQLTGRGRGGSRVRPLAAVSAVVVAVVAVAVGLSMTGPLHNGGRKTPSPSSSPSTLSLPGPTGPEVSVTALKGYRWGALPDAPIPVRGEAASAWTGQLLIVWGGQTPGRQLRSDGATYNPATRAWTKLPASPLTVRANALGVWVAGSFVVWGGADARGRHLTDGARYDPRSGTWTKLPKAPITSYGWAELVVAGNKAVLISAADGSRGIIRADAYDPAGNTWRAMPDLRTSRTHQVLYGSALGVGHAVFVWSDWYHATRPTKNSVSIASGVDTYALDIRTATWSPVPLKPDQGRDVHQPIWTGQHFLLAGEQIYCGPCSTPSAAQGPGVLVDPRTAKRTHIPTGPVSVGLTGYYWTGSALLGIDLSTEVIGSRHDVHPGNIAAWDPDTNTWTSLASTQLNGGGEAVTVWTGTRLLVWGISDAHGRSRPAAGLQFAPGP